MISKLLLNSSPTPEADQKWSEVDSRYVGLEQRAVLDQALRHSLDIQC
jgi:hypothetical protein